MRSTIKLLGTAMLSPEGDKLSVFVSPVLVPLSHPIASARGPGNIVSVDSKVSDSLDLPIVAPYHIGRRPVFLFSDNRENSAMPLFEAFMPGKCRQWLASFDSVRGSSSTPRLRLPLVSRCDARLNTGNLSLRSVRHCITLRLLCAVLTVRRTRLP